MIDPEWIERYRAMHGVEISRQQVTRSARWPVSPDCPAGYHNTLHAATRRGAGGGMLCVCDHALELRAAYLKNRRVRESRVKPAARADETSRTLGAVSRALDALSAEGALRTSPPDMTKAACATQHGLHLLDAATDGRSSSSDYFRKKFVGLCLSECAIYRDCLAWVIAGEGVFPGSWGKIYAGLTVNDRRRLAKDRQGWDERDKQAGSSAAQHADDARSGAA